MRIVIALLRPLGRLIIYQERNTFCLFRKTGALNREIRDIKTQITQEENKDLKSKIERLALDLKAIQTENAALVKEIKQNN